MLFSRLIFSCLSLIVVTSSATSQTLFRQPPRPVDVANYTTIEECRALLDRLQDSVARSTPLRIDTFPAATADKFKQHPLPVAVLTMAQRCAAQFPVSAISSDRVRDFLPLLLQAGRDADADTLMTQFLRRHKAFDGDTTDAARIELLAQMLAMYRNARPARYVSALRLLEPELQHAPVGSLPRFWLLVKMAEISTEQGDSARSRTFTALANAESRMIPNMQTLKITVGYTRLGVEMLGDLMRQELLDSLRLNIQTYIALRRSDKRFASLSAGPPEVATIKQIGDQVSAIYADFWFPSETTTTTAPPVSAKPVRPSAGKTALIVFLGQDCRRSEEAQGGQRRDYRPVADQECFDLYAMLKRVVHRFPSIELTIATQTYGYVWPSGPIEPDVEAGYLRQWWLGFHQLPATLAVTNTPNWFLETPDARRLYNAIPNANAYLTATRSAVLANRNGIIVERFDHLTRHDEEWLTQLLSVIEPK